MGPHFSYLTCPVCGLTGGTGPMRRFHFENCKQPLFDSVTVPDPQKAWERYSQQKGNAIDRGIPFELTYKEWCDWWMETGHYHERGKGQKKYCMGRIGDVGPYKLGNILCLTNEANAAMVKGSAERMAEMNRRPNSRERSRRSLIVSNQTPAIRAMRSKQMMGNTFAKRKSPRV